MCNFSSGPDFYDFSIGPNVPGICLLGSVCWPSIDGFDVSRPSPLRNSWTDHMESLAFCHFSFSVFLAALEKSENVFP